MYTHAPADYVCPICIAIQGIEDDRTMIRTSDIVFQDDLVTVFIGSFSVAGRPSQPIIVPNKHYENLYALPEKEAQRIMVVSRIVALATKKVYECDGVMVRQNNEPASGQHAFHYHMHIFPRDTDDEFDTNIHISRQTTPEERRPYATKLRDELQKAVTAQDL